MPGDKPLIEELFVNPDPQSYINPELPVATTLA